VFVRVVVVRENAIVATNVTDSELTLVPVELISLNALEP